MKAAARYLRILEGWDLLAAEQQVATEWAERTAEALPEYLRWSLEAQQRPTLVGFMVHLCGMAAQSIEKEASNDRD